jgi:hypothetical protein
MERPVQQLTPATFLRFGTVVYLLYQFDIGQFHCLRYIYIHDVSGVKYTSVFRQLVVILKRLLFHLYCPDQLRPTQTPIQWVPGDLFRG